MQKRGQKKRPAGFGEPVLSEFPSIFRIPTGAGKAANCFGVEDVWSQEDALR
jgi:hypothetical protein